MFCNRLDVYLIHTPSCNHLDFDDLDKMIFNSNGTILAEVDTIGEDTDTHVVLLIPKE